MSQSVLIRPFKISDGGAVAALWRDVLPSSQPWNEPTGVICRKLQAADGLFFVGERANHIVATVMAGYDGIRGWIYSLAVTRDIQRQGIGRQMLEHAEAALRARGCPKVNLQVRETNLPVVEFYRRAGYEVEDRASLGKPLLSTDTPLIPDPVPALAVRPGITLSQITWDDKPAYLRLLNETDRFYQQMAVMPYPYTELDADNWLSKATSERLDTHRSRSWAIRADDGQLIGGIGLAGITRNDRAELGYWLAQSYWGQGIVTAAARTVCDFAIDEYNLRRIYAQAFATNPASCRVLEKSGFELEGTLRSHFFRDGQAHDLHCYGRVRPA